METQPKIIIKERKQENSPTHMRGELNSLLLLTEAINKNLGALELYEIFRQILEQHFGLYDIILIYNQGKKWKVFKKLEQQIDIEEYAEEIQEAQQRKEKNLQGTRIREEHGYTRMMDVKHKEQILAYLLFKGEVNEIETYKFIRTLTNIIAVAIENKRLFREKIDQEQYRKELEIARQVQQMMIPRIFPVTPEIQFATTYIPHSNVSGDYYDLIELDKDSVLFCIADVAGKGVPAALLMANLQANLRRLAINFSNLTDMVRELNKVVFNNTQGERFVTLFLAVYNDKTDEITYINAGHNAPILMFNNHYQLLKKGCTVIGVIPELITIEEEKVKVEQDSMLIMYTDGVTEAKDHRGMLLGEKGLVNFVIGRGQKEPTKLNEELKNYILNYAQQGEIKDDLTIFTCKIVPTAIKEKTNV